MQRSTPLKAVLRSWADVKDTLFYLLLFETDVGCREVVPCLCILRWGGGERERGREREREINKYNIENERRRRGEGWSGQAKGKTSEARKTNREKQSLSGGTNNRSDHGDAPGKDIVLAHSWCVSVSVCVCAGGRGADLLTPSK